MLNSYLIVDINSSFIDIFNFNYVLIRLTKSIYIQPENKKTEISSDLLGFNLLENKICKLMFF